MVRPPFFTFPLLSDLMQEVQDEEDEEDDYGDEDCREVECYYFFKILSPEKTREVHQYHVFFFAKKTQDDDEDGDDAEGADGDELDGQNSSRTTRTAQSGRSRQSHASGRSRSGGPEDSQFLDWWKVPISGYLFGVFIAVLRPK